jgi:hypothetical protein
MTLDKRFSFMFESKINNWTQSLNSFLYNFVEVVLRRVDIVLTKCIQNNKSVLC